MSHALVDLATLTPTAKLELIERLWDSLEPSSVPITPEQRAELDRRLDAADRDTWRMLTVEELREHLGRRRR
jgi:putative addiction module component (TIGR02574 family)